MMSLQNSVSCKIMRFRGRASPGNLVINFTACKYQILSVECKFVSHLLVLAAEIKQEVYNNNKPAHSARDSPFSFLA